MEDRRDPNPQAGESRRDAIKKMVYAAPLVLSFAAAPAFASSGSPRGLNKGSKSPRKSKPRSLNNSGH
jgi:hypothetical protein